MGRARDALMSRADAALSHQAYTVVAKTRLPASGDRHDYMSMGPYWWPDPTRPDGLPYIRRDGQTNPERSTNAFDLSKLDALSRDIQALSMAWYLTSDPRYAAKASLMIKTWFLDPSTRMNPNLNHAQGIPGRVAGRAEGVLDAFRLVGIVESLGLLDTSDALTQEERAALKDWFSALLDWMLTSEIGLAEAAATNNHGVFYDMMVAQFALFSGREDLARTVSERFGSKRIAAQIEPDGRLPHELARTRSLHYSTWTLTAAFDMADIARCVGVDLWTFRTADGRSLQTATRFVGQWAGREAHWPYPELDKTKTDSLFQILRRGAWAWSDPELEAGAALYADRYGEAALNLRLPPYAP